MHIVEIRRTRANLGNIMAQMRTWIDHRRIELSTFEVAFISGGEVRFRVEFQNMRDASAFARVFEGEVLTSGSDTAAA